MADKFIMYLFGLHKLWKRAYPISHNFYLLTLW